MHKPHNLLPESFRGSPISLLPALQPILPGIVLLVFPTGGLGEVRHEWRPICPKTINGRNELRFTGAYENKPLNFVKTYKKRRKRNYQGAAIEFDKFGI